jgi:hypothetical protein
MSRQPEGVDDHDEQHVRRKVGNRMDLDEKLARAFSAWSQARDGLGLLRQRAGQAGAGGQFAASPEAAAVMAQIGEQEDTCRRLFADLVTVAEHRAALIEQQEVEQMARSVASRKS